MPPTDDPIRVLHVDDDPAFAEMAATFLERADERLTVDTARSVEEGLDRLSAADVDCVVSDYDMPGTNGLEFLASVRETHPDLPFILYTGKGSEEVASDAISSGVTEYLQKGGSTEQYEVLAHRIGNAVEAARATAAAERRRHRLEQLLKTVPGCVVQLDADGRFTYANRRAEEVLGLDPAAVATRTYNDPEWRIRDLDGDPIPDAELPFRRVLDSGEPLYGVEHSIRWPDGTRRVLLVNGAPLFGDDGSVESVVFSLVDVTRQHDRDRDLSETERRLELVLEATDTGVWEWDRETDDVRWTDTLERVMGLEPGSFEGTFEAFRERVHPEDRPAVESALEAAVETDGTYGTTFRMHHEDGGVRWVAVRGHLVDDGRRMVGVHQDVTERRRLRADLQDSIERYRVLVENFPDGGVYLYNRDLECVLAGGAGLADVGLTSADVEGDRPSARYPEPIAVEIEAHLRAAFEGEEGTFEQSYRGREYQVWTGPIERTDGTVERVMAVSQEITDRKRRERQLERQNARLEEFASVVSHDLRNPLRVADGRVQLARGDCDSEHLDAVETALDRMDRIIADVLELARQGRDIGRTRPVDLRAQIADAWALTADSGTDAELVVTADPDGVETVEADPTRLNQLLENLFRNAIEHGGDDVTVTVRLLADGFHVEDDGPGIPPADRESAFEVGYSTSAGGTGFGLRIVEQIAAAHGWAVAIGEGDDGGARFVVSDVESGS